MTDEPRPLAAMLDTPDLGALARPASSEDRPAVSASGLTPQALGSAITALLGQIQAAAQARVARAGQMTQGPFHSPGGIDQAAGGALGLVGNIQMPADKAARVFHGTGEAFTAFDPSKARHPGFWFSDSPHEAAKYAVGPAPNMHAASLAIQHPAPPEVYARLVAAVEQAAQRVGVSLSRRQIHDGVAAHLAAHGFDSVAVPGVGGATQFAVFDPAKIGPPRR